MPKAPGAVHAVVSQTAEVPAAACELPRAVIRLPQCKNISQFVLFVESSISTWRTLPPVSGPRGQFRWPQPGSCPGPGAFSI